MASKTKENVEKNDIPLSNLSEKDYESNLVTVETPVTKKNNEVRKPIS